LHLVASLIEKHGGSVDVSSDGAGTGSEFVVRVPATGQARPESHPQPAPADAGRSPTLQRVLIVDDHANILDSIARVMRKKGHEVRTASSAQGALAQIPTFKPSVVLADIGLPDLDGFELAARLRTAPTTEHATLIALTGFADDDVRSQAREAGYDHLLVKPPEFAVLDALLGSAGQPSLAEAAPGAKDETVREH
jgi:CheY-like chemotaxis protein